MQIQCACWNLCKAKFQLGFSKRESREETERVIVKRTRYFVQPFREHGSTPWGRGGGHKEEEGKREGRCGPRAHGCSEVAKWRIYNLHNSVVSSRNVRRCLKAELWCQPGNSGCVAEAVRRPKLRNDTQGKALSSEKAAQKESMDAQLSRSRCRLSRPGREGIPFADASRGKGRECLS